MLRQSRRVRRKVVRRSLSYSIWVPLAFSSEVKGWRRFAIADARASFVPLGGRGVDEREKETPASAGRRPRPRMKTGRSIRRRSNSPASPSPIRRRANGQADGRQPFMPSRVSHDPYLQTYPSRSLMRGECGRFPLGALIRAFIQQRDYLSVITLLCNKFQAIC